jgi:putative addiction module killer protein
MPIATVCESGKMQDTLVDKLYFRKRGRKLIILLAGGDKSTQTTDIKAALRLAQKLSD